MNILYIAFSCSPTNGSEDSVGWNIPSASSKYNKVYVITKESAKNVIDNYMKEHNDTDMKFFYVDIPDIYKKLFKGFLFSGRLNLFHKAALPLTAKICKEYDIDIIHQITPVEFRAIGNYGQIPNAKFVCGPVGGGRICAYRIVDIH